MWREHVPIGIICKWNSKLFWYLLLGKLFAINVSKAKVRWKLSALKSFQKLSNSSRETWNEKSITRCWTKTNKDYKLCFDTRYFSANDFMQPLIFILSLFLFASQVNLFFSTNLLCIFSLHHKEYYFIFKCLDDILTV